MVFVVRAEDRVLERGQDALAVGCPEQLGQDERPGVVGECRCEADSQM
jgi:hypothetical protein